MRIKEGVIREVGGELTWSPKKCSWFSKTRRPYHRTDLLWKARLMLCQFIMGNFDFMKKKLLIRGPHMTQDKSRLHSSYRNNVNSICVACLIISIPQDSVVLLKLISWHFFTLSLHRHMCSFCVYLKRFGNGLLSATFVSFPIWLSMTVTDDA